MDRQHDDLTRRIVIGVYILAFAVGTFMHAADILAYGLFPYGGVPGWMNAYWTALTIIDPLTIALLILRRRAGLVLAVLVMMSDVTINAFAAFGLGLDGFLLALSLQSAFLGFVLGSVWFLWPAHNDRSHAF